MILAHKIRLKLLCVKYTVNPGLRAPLALTLKRASGIFYPIFDFYKYFGYKYRYLSLLSGNKTMDCVTELINSICDIFKINEHKIVLNKTKSTHDETEQKKIIKK